MVGIRAHGIAQGDRLGEPAREELLVDGLVVAREQADGDLAARSIEGLADEPAAFVREAHDLAAAERLRRGDVRAVDPDVTRGEAVDGAPREHDRRLVGGALADAAEHGRRALDALPWGGAWAHVAGRARAVLQALLPARFLRRSGRLG